MQQVGEKPTEESVRMAMDLAWRDHHHARDQTWRALQIEAVLGAGLVTVDAQFHNAIATGCAGALVIIAALSGFLITRHHRRLERRKFIHIINCEEWLGLHRDDLIPLAAEDPKKDQRPPMVKEGAVSVPSKVGWWSILNPCVQNTTVFIARMHLAIIAFGVLMIVLRARRAWQS